MSNQTRMIKKAEKLHQKAKKAAIQLELLYGSVDNLPVINAYYRAGPVNFAILKNENERFTRRDSEQWDRLESISKERSELEEANGALLVTIDELKEDIAASEAQNTRLQEQLAESRTVALNANDRNLLSALNGNLVRLSKNSEGVEKSA